MRIGAIAPPWIPVPPRTDGGTESVVDLLARGLADRGHAVRLFATGDSRCPVDRRWVHERAQGFEGAGSLPEVRHVLAAYEALADCDLVHDHSVLGSLLAPESAPPVVTTVHGTLDATAAPVLRDTAQRATVVAISHAQRLQAPDVPVDAVIHHGIDLARIPVGPGDGGYVAFLGRMAPEKGVHRAIRAARQAGLPLRIAAKMWQPDERRYFAERVEPELDGGDVVFVGELDDAAKHELLGRARALIMPVRWCEPFGLVMVEALACGTPVVAFPEGAAPEIVRHGENGLLCATEADMVDALDRIGAVDRRACRLDVERRFAADRMVADYEALFELVLADRRTPQLVACSPMGA